MRAFILVFLCCMASFASAAGKSYRDKDWSFSAYDNCGLPVPSGPQKSIAWVKSDGDRKLRFVLNPGDKGRCSTDDQARNHAPYWERAELHQKGYLSLGKAHRIRFQAVFEKGFSGDREAFFQIHAWNGNCHVSPPLMMMFDRGKLTIWALRGVTGDGMGSQRGQHKPVQRKHVAISSLYGKKSDFTVTFDTRTQPGKLSVSLNGISIVQNSPIEFARCAKPHVKFGIYRPGGKGSATSAVIFDDFTLE